LKWLDPNISADAIELIHTCVRKSAHFIEYSILGVLIWRLVHTAPSLAMQSRARHFRLALLIAACYAATDETHQIFVPTRQPAIHDVCLDTFGAACGLGLACWVDSRRKPK
jgi:VanZ family protein